MAAGEEIDSAAIVLKAVMRLYGEAFDDVNYDRDRYLDLLLEEVLSYEGIDREMISRIEKELRIVGERNWVEFIAEPGVMYTNGIWLEERDGRYRIHTPGNSYSVGKQEVSGKEIELSQGLRIEERDGLLVLSLGLLSTVGGVNTGIEGDAVNYALPPEEVPGGNFIEYTGVINEIAAQLLWALRRTEFADGRVRDPYLTMLMGPTGGAKSTLVRSLGSVLGVPVFTLNCFMGMEPDSVIGGLEQEQGRKLEFQLKEFFSHLGKIDGEYRWPEGKQSHSRRKLLFLDEANVSPEILYLLRPLFNGQKKFKINYLGLEFEVELDPEVMVVLAGNPEDRFAGREGYPRVLLEKGVKVWVPALHQYLESERVDVADARAVLRGQHQRKMKKEPQKPPAAEEEVLELEASPVKVASLPAGVTYRQRKKVDRKKLKREEKTEGKKIMPVTKEQQKFRYDINNIVAGMAYLHQAEDKLVFFLDNILPDFMLALSDGAVGARGWVHNHSSLAYQVIATALVVDQDLHNFLIKVVNPYGREKISLKEIRSELLAFRQLLLRREVPRFLFSFMTKKKDSGQRHLLVRTVPIQRRISVEKMQELEIPAEVESRLPLHAYAVPGHPFGEDERAAGVFKGHSDEEGYYAVIYGSSSRIAADVGITELYDWVGFHELGHLVSDLRLRFEQKKHPNLELFPLLFPLIFAANPDKYLEKDLLQQLYLRDKDSAYCQAAKGVINGILRVLKEENPGDEELQALLEITDDFDPNSIKEYVKVVLSLSDKDLRRIAKKMYRDAYEKSFQGDFYLDSAKAGKYPRQPGPGVEGDLISEFAEGEVLQSPDVDMGDLSEEEQEKVEQEIEVSGEGVTEKEEVPEIEEDLEGPGTLTDTGMGTGTGKGTVSVVRGGWVEEYVRKYARYAHQFLEPFFIEPEREEVHSRSGRKIDIRRWLYGALRVFKKTVFDDSRPELAMDITVDVSGSITTRPELVSGFTQMSKFFLSMLYQAANQHREGVAYGLSAIGEEFHDSIPLSNRHSEGKLNETVFSDDKAWLEAHDDHQGINTVNLIAGLREKWKAKRDVPQENRLEIVFTDGDETSGDSKEHFQKLRRMALALERECNINIVFVGVGTREVENYHRYLVLPALPKPEQLISVVSRLGRGLVDRGLLPTGDMAPMVGLAARQKQAALIPSLQEKFSFGQATGYKYGLGPILEEILYRYSPAAVFMKGLMPKWYENIFAKSRLRRMLTGIGFSIAFFGLAALAVNSWIGVVLLALLYLPLTWGFITAHPDWRENKLASTVGVINAAIIIIALSLNAWIGLVLPLVVHIVANIMAPEKTAAAEPVVAEEKPEVSLSIGEKIADLKSALSRGEPGAARELEILFSSPQVTGKDRSDIIKALRIQLEEQGSDDCFASLANLLEEMENDFKTTSDSKYKNNIVMAIYVLLGRSGNFRRVSIRSLAEGLIGTMPTDFADSGYNDYKQTIILILLRFACEGSKEAMVALEAIYPLATAVEKTKMISYFETLFQARWRNNSFVFPAPLDEKADRALESLYHSGESGEESRKRIVDELGAFVGTGQKSAAKMLEAFFISPQATKKEKEMIIKVLGNASSVGLNVFEDLFNSPQATQEDRLNIVTMLLAKDDTGDLKNAIELVVSLYGSPQATVADKINILNSLRGFYEKQSGIVLFSGDTLLGIREQMKIDFMNAEEAGSKAAILNFYVDVILPFGSRDAVFPLVIMGAKLKSDFMATTDLEYKKSILNILTQLSWQEDYSEAEEAAQMLAGFVETIKTEFASTADSDYRRAAGAALVALVCYDDPDAEEFLEDTFNSPETSTEDKMRIITVLANIPSRYQAPAVSFLDRFRVKMMSDFTLTADAAYRKAIINVLGVLVCDRNTDAEKNLQALFNSPQITAEDRNKIIAALKDAFLKKGVHTAGETLAALFSSGMADTENKAEIVRALTTGSEHSVYGALELLENLAGDFQNDYEQAASADYKNALSGALVKLSLSGDEKVHRAARLFLWQLFQSQETIYEIKERIRKTFMKMPAGWMARTCKINIKLARHLKQRGQYERLLNDDFRRKMNELSYSLNRERTLHPAERRVGEDEKTSLFDYLFALESLAEVQGVFDAYFRNDPDQYRIELIHLIELLQYLSIDDVKMLIRTVVEDPKEALDEVKANIKRKVEGQENADFVLRRMEWILSNLFVLQNRIRQLEKIAKKLTTMEELIGILRLIDAKGKFYQLAALAGERDLYAIAVLRLKLDSLSQEAREDLLVDAWESLDSWKDEDEKEVLREELSAQFRNQPAASKTRIYLRLICGRYTDNTNNKLLLRRLKQLRETGGIASTGKRDKNPLMMPKLTAFLADNFWAIESNSLLFSFIDSITTLAGKVQKQAAYTAFRTLYRERKLPEAVPEISAQLRELYQQIALPEKQVQLPHVFYEPLLKIGPERQALDLLRALIAALNANEDLQNQLAVLKNRLYEKLIAFSGLEYEQKGELFSALVRLVEDKYGAPAEENAAEFHGRLMLHLEQFMDIINALQKAEAGKFTADLNERIKGLGQTVLDGVLLEGKIRGGALHQLQTILANLEADILLARFKMVIEVENEEELLAKLVRYRRDNPSAQWTDHEGRGIYKLIDIYLSTINDEEVYRNILNALIAEVEGRFKGWKYQSADYQDTLTEIIEIEIEKLPREERKSLRELLAEAEGETLYEKLQQIEGYAELKAYITKVKSWEEMLSYETEDGRRAEFTDDFYTLFNIGNYAGSTACQSCTYGNNLNRGLAGYLVNGTNKAVALLDEEGRVVTRRMVRLRIVTDERGNKQPVIFVEESTQFGVEELEKLYAILDILSQRTGLPVMVGAYRPAHLPGFAQVKEKDFTFEFIAGRSSFDYSDFYGHSAPGQITAGLFRYPETVMQADLEEFTLLVMPESNIRETEIEKRYGLTKAAVEEVEVMPEEQAAKPASPAPQIGKKVEVKEIVYNDQGQVAGFKVKGRKEVIPLAKSTVDFDAEALAVKDQLLEPGDATVIAAIFSAFGRTNASVFTFSELIEDLFGFARPGDSLIALQQSLAKNPLALLHEVMEYLIDAGMLQLRVKDGSKLVVTVNGREMEPIELKEEALAIAGKGIDSPHYLLRALQRQLFGKKDKDLTAVIKAEQLLRDLESIVEIDQEKIGPVRDKIIELTEMIREGREVTEEELRVDVNVILASNLSQEVKFQLIARIARFVNNITPAGSQVSRGLLVAKIEEEILGAIKAESQWKMLVMRERSLREAVAKIAAQKGIPSEEIWGTFDLFKDGMNILTMDPDLDPGQIDEGYFTLIQEIARLTGMSEGKIAKAFGQDYGIEKVTVTQGKSIPGTELSRRADLLGAYNSLWEDTQELLEFVPVAVREKAEPAMVVLHLDQFPLEIFQEEGAANYPPGLMAVLSSIKNGEKVKLGLRVPATEMDRVRRIIEQLSELKGRVELLPEDTGEAQQELERQGFSNFTFVAREGDSFSEDVKAFRMEEGSAFHAVFLFGVMYARADKDNLDEIKDVVRMLVDFGMDRAVVEKILADMDLAQGIVFFTVGLTRISEVLRQFQLRRLLIDVAA